MTRDEAKIAAIELAKAAMSSDAGTVSVYPNSTSANEVADFIDTLIVRLTTE